MNQVPREDLIMIRKKNVVILLLLGVFLIMVATPSSLAQKQLKGKVSIWGGYYLNALTKYAMEARFLKHHPEVKVEYGSYPYADYPLKMKMALGAQDSDPDIMTIHGHWVGEFYAYGHLLELTDKLGKERIQDYLTWMWKPIRDSEGRIWGLPFEGVISGLYYRKDVYEEYGLSVPQTRDEFVTVGQKLGGQGKYGGIFDVQNGDRVNSIVIAGTSGLDWFNSEGEVILDTPQGKGVYSAKLIKELVDTGIFFPMRYGAPETYSALEEGTIASFLAPSSVTKSLRANISEKSEGFGMWRFSLPPQMVNNPVSDLVSYTSVYMVISQWSDNKDLAWEVVKWCKSSIEGDKLMAIKDAVMGAYIPALKELAEEGSPIWPLFNQQISSKFAKILLTHSVRQPTPHMFLADAQRIWTEESAYMFAGEKTPEQAIKDAADKIRKSVER